MAILFKNPANGYIESSSNAWLWCLLFGIFYFLFKGIWTHAVIGFVLAVLTGGISWLIYPFFAKSIVINSYSRKGWIQVSDI